MQKSHILSFLINSYTDDLFLMFIFFLLVFACFWSLIIRSRLHYIKKINFRKRRARSDNTVGITFARLGNYSMAIDYFKKAVENDMEELDYKVNLAVALYRMYKYDEAMGYYEEVKKAKPELVTQLDFIESMGEITPKFNKFD